MSPHTSEDALLPERPRVIPPEPWAFPVPNESSLDNGITVLTYDLPGQHVIAVRLVIPLNLADEPREREGISSMMARLLDEGAGGLSSEEFAEALERKGVALGAGVSDGGLLVDLDVPARFLTDALELLTLAISAPAFPEDEVRRILRSRLAEIEQERASAPHRGARELIATLYDDAERASRPTAGSAETIRSITREDIAHHFATRVGPQGASVTIAGDMSGIDLDHALASTLGRWHAPDHQPARRPHAPRRADDATRIVLVDRPGSVQSEISIGAVGPARSIASGWAPHPVLAFLLGGSPSARIDAVLREEKGYTYGIRSAFRPRVAAGMFLTSGSVRADTTAESVKILLDLLEGLREGVTDAEVKAGVDFIERTAPGRYGTADAVADESAALVLEGLPRDFTTTNLRALARLSSADLDKAWSAIGKEGWTCVIVGDVVTYRDMLEQLGIGPLSVVAN